MVHVKVPRRMMHAARQTTSLAWRLVGHVGAGAGSLLLPAACSICGLDSLGLSAVEDLVNGGSSGLCDDCLESLKLGGTSTCPCCGSRSPVGSADGRCPACRGRRFQYRFITALGPYDGSLRDAVLRTKHSTEHSLTTTLAELLWRQCGDRLAAFRPDVVVPVPMHWWHRLRRGDNGPDIICEVLARRLGVLAAPNLLARRRNTLPQSNLAHGRRRRNVRHAFRVRSSFVLQHARVLLVDDILTSGATAHEAADTLRQAGASEVAVAVLARAERPA